MNFSSIFYGFPKKISLNFLLGRVICIYKKDIKVQYLNNWWLPFFSFWQINIFLETYHWNESWRKGDRQRGKIKTKKEAGKEENYENELKTLWFTSQQFENWFSGNISKSRRRIIRRTYLRKNTEGRRKNFLRRTLARQNMQRCRALKGEENTKLQNSK